MIISIKNDHMSSFLPTFFYTISVLRQSNFISVQAQVSLKTKYHEKFERSRKDLSNIANNGSTLTFPKEV